MALQLDYVDPTTEIAAPAAYARVTGIVVDCLAQTIDLAVGLYYTQAARSGGGQPFSTYHAWPDYIAFLGQPVDVRSAAYVYLKTLAPFAGASDV